MYYVCLERENYSELFIIIEKKTMKLEYENVII